MSIHVHKTGLNDTTGRTGASIVTTNLIGNFVPNLGVAAGAWTNQAASNGLRRLNGLTHNNSAPHNFQFDGTDDYFAAGTVAYGGAEFQVAFQNAYTISEWIYLPSDWGSGKQCFLFYFYHGAGNHLMVQIDNPIMELHSYSDSGNKYNASFGQGFNLAINRSRWLYHTIVHDGNGVYTYYLNGSFAGSINAGAVPNATAQAMIVGRYTFDGGGSYSYSSAGVKVGHIHVHSSALTNSQIMQNYLASHDMHNTRLYGDTTLAW